MKRRIFVNTVDGECVVISHNEEVDGIFEDRLTLSSGVFSVTSKTSEKSQWLFPLSSVISIEIRPFREQKDDANDRH